MRMALVETGLDLFVEATLYGSFVLGIWYASQQIIDGRLSAGNVVSFIFVAVTLVEVCC